MEKCMKRFNYMAGTHGRSAPLRAAAHSFVRAGWQGSSPARLRHAAARRAAFRLWTRALLFLAVAPLAWAQSQYIGYVYPAGGQQGSTFPIRLGGQGLVHASDLVVSGEGVSVRLVDYHRVMNNE